MKYLYRAATADELAACLACSYNTFPGAPALHQEVPQVWRRLAAQGSLLATICEPEDSQGDLYQAHMSIAVFVTDCFASEITRLPRPSAHEALLWRELAGQPVVLSLDQARCANQAQGLNLFFLRDPLSQPGLSWDEVQAINDAWGASLVEYRACNLKSVTWECYNEIVRDMAAHCGMDLKCDWAAYWQQQEHNPPQNQRPYLMHLTREEAEARIGTHIWGMFRHDPAHFHFSEAQQAMLKRALQGETDDELAAALYLSVSAVKKRWQAIYARVQTVVPGLLGGEDDQDRQTRGAEKRRYLLNYLRAHPEELHPINAAVGNLRSVG